jgi:hypothetical protein
LQTTIEVRNGELAADEVAAEGRHSGERSRARAVDALRSAGAKVVEEAGPGLLRRPEDDRVGVPRGLLGPRGHVEPSEHHVGATGPVAIGDRVGAPG